MFQTGTRRGTQVSELIGESRGEKNNHKEGNVIFGPKRGGGVRKFEKTSG